MTHMSEVKYLVVEDDEPKLRSIQSFVAEVDRTGTILVARSVVGAIGVLSNCDVRFAIIDMSLPTYEVASDRGGGGAPQGFGGSDLLRFIEAQNSNTRSIVVTQYEEFAVSGFGPKRGLSELSEQLFKELPSSLVAVIHYEGPRGEWRKRMKTELEKCGAI